MATEEDRQDERDRMGNEPLHPPAEELEEENPAESPAQAGERQDHAEHAREASQERAASSTERERPVAKSTEGQTVGGTEKTPGA
jgi:hypothetical protein